MIILASAIIISLNNTGIIENAKEAVFKEDVRAYQTELSLYVADLLAVNPKLDYATVNATASTTPSITAMIKSMKADHASKFEVQSGALVYVGTDADETTWVTELGLEVKEKVLTQAEYEAKYVTEIAAAATYGTYSNNVYTVTSAVPAGTKIALAYGTTTIQLTSEYNINAGTPLIPDYNNVILPSTLTTIGMNVFAYTDTTNIVIPFGVTSIGAGAFYTSSVTTIDLPSTLTAIGGCAFNFCDNLEALDIPEGVTELISPIDSCKNITQITLPKSLQTYIDVPLSGPFNTCPKLTTINYRGTQTEFEQIELHYSDLEYEEYIGAPPTWPTGVTYVYNYAG